MRTSSPGSFTYTRLHLALVPNPPCPLLPSRASSNCSITTLCPYATPLPHKSIQEAYAILSDPSKRREYDSVDTFDDSLPSECASQDFFKVTVIRREWSTGSRNEPSEQGGREAIEGRWPWEECGEREGLRAFLVICRGEDG